MAEVDDFPLTIYEWNDFLEGLDEFNIIRIGPRQPASFYPILLYDAIVLFDKQDWDLALNGVKLTWEE